MRRFSFCFFGSSRWRIEVAKAVIKGGEFVLFVRDLYVLVFDILLSEETQILHAGNRYTFSSKGLKKSTCYTEAKGGISKKKKEKTKTSNQKPAESVYIYKTPTPLCCPLILSSRLLLYGAQYGSSAEPILALTPSCER